MNYTNKATVLGTIAALNLSLFAPNVFAKEQSEPTGTVEASNLYVRSEPSIKGKVLGSLKKGQAVSITKQQNGWGTILFNGEKAYISMDYIKPIASKEHATSRETATVTADKLNIRASASTSSKLLGKLNKGQTVSVLAKQGAWTKISFNGTDAFVSTEFLRFVTNPAPAPTPAPSAPESATVTADKLNVRSSASTSAKVLGKLNKGQTVSVLAKQGAWTKISFNGTDAFVSTEFLRFVTNPAPTPTPAPSAPESATVTADKLNVRSSASTSAKVLGKLNKGQTVSVLAKQGAWTKISFNGTDAFVSTEFLRFVTNPAPAPTPEPPKTESATVTATLLHVYATASSQAEIVDKMKKGSKVDVIGQEKTWTKIWLNGREAFVLTKYLQFKDTPLKETIKKQITVPQTTVYDKAAYTGKSLGVVKQNSEVQVLSEAKGWLTILFNDKEAFIPALAVQPLQEEETSVTTATLNVRSTPSTSGAIVGKLNQGQSVIIVSKENGWGKIAFNGKYAYISLGYVKTDKGTASYSIVTGSYSMLQANQQEAAKAFASLKSDGYVTRNGKIIDMKQGFVRTNKVTNIYDLQTHKQVTYVAPNTDLKFVKVDGSRIHVSFDGKNGYVFAQDVELHPNLLKTKTSFYTVKAGNILYNSYQVATNSYYVLNEGYAPTHLKDGVQYTAFDRTLIGGKESYQYFAYLPLRVSSSYTAAELDAFIRASRPDSPLIGTGIYFIEAANKYNMNAAYLLSHAIVESAWGTSRIAREKNNLFGFKAVDSNPYDGAASFATLQEGIDYCAGYIDRNYLTPDAKFYNGAFLGDKARGMNVLYASDSNWSRNISSVMHRLDKMYSNRNYKTYELGRVTEGTVLLANLAGKKAATVGKDITVAIKGTTQTSQGTYYEVFSDSSAYTTLFIHESQVKKIHTY
ncbi:SH3 domain-containing protein [Ectobacillus sp. JY-23]|uniref:SH3 domain-containing protein n=1 Tax=Ectobacillus sp. JY-23 TaxID=2933872 RepID=UPI001FF6597C|nr:SH3 domain-containing protein [Ectobacillus sp. JY-23]UOY91613.1 SH3 domain-containing protein [Ectobacillus sp. JY-23]